MPVGRGGGGHGGQKHGQTVTAYCLVFTECGSILAPLLISLTTISSPGEKTVKSRKYDIYILCCCAALLTKSIQCSYSGTPL